MGMVLCCSDQGKHGLRGVGSAGTGTNSGGVHPQPMHTSCRPCGQHSNSCWWLACRKAAWGMREAPDGQLRLQPQRCSHCCCSRQGPHAVPAALVHSHCCCSRQGLHAVPAALVHTGRDRLHDEERSASTIACHDNLSHADLTPREYRPPTGCMLQGPTSFLALIRLLVLVLVPVLGVGLALRQLVLVVNHRCGGLCCW
jgi:ribosomal protein L37E